MAYPTAGERTERNRRIAAALSAEENRPLETVYPFVFLDAIHYKVKENHQYQTKAAYVVLGVTMDGTKDILGVWTREHESSKFHPKKYTEPLSSHFVFTKRLICG